MSAHEDIPVLTDLIESGTEITLSDLGLDGPDVEENIASQADDIEIEIDDTALELSDHQAGPAVLEHEYLADNPALEQEVRRILDEHMELAWQEIRLAIQRHLDRP